MSIPSLDLHGYRYDEVPNEVVRFLEDHLGKESFLDIITGKSEKMKKEVIKILKQYELEYLTGLPLFAGKIRVLLFDYKTKDGW
jgi:DNA-nicking Smr family endonuclease